MPFDDPNNVTDVEFEADAKTPWESPKEYEPRTPRVNWTKVREQERTWDWYDEEEDAVDKDKTELLRAILKASEKDTRIISPKPGDTLACKEGNPQSEITLLRKEVERLQKDYVAAKKGLEASEKRVLHWQAVAKQSQQDYANLRNDVDTAETFEYVRRLECLRNENAALQKAIDKPNDETGKRLKAFEDATLAFWNANQKGSSGRMEAINAGTKLLALIGKKP